MELLIKRIVKVVFFAITFYATARLYLSLLRRKNSSMKLLDPEIVFLAGISAALATMLFSKVLLPLL